MELINSQFSHNAIPQGFAAGIAGRDNIQVIMSNTTFAYNTAACYGGGVIEVRKDNNITQSGAFNMTISNCTFDHNNVASTLDIVAAGGGLGALVTGGGDASSMMPDIFHITITNTDFKNNNGDVQGGGLYIQNATASLFNVNFINNQATFAGGMIAAFTSVIPIMQNVAFIDNFAPNSDIFGPADSGGMDVVVGTQVQSMKNVLFLQNVTQASGGGILLGFDDPSTAQSSIGAMKNISFIGNSAAVQGNAIFCDNNQIIGPFINTFFGQNQNIVGCTISP